MLQTQVQEPQWPGATPLDELQFQRLLQAVQGFNATQLVWASGFLAGRSQPEPQATQIPDDPPRLTILYASQAGNARSVAELLAAGANARGLPHRLLSVADYRPRDLAKERLLVLVTSTQGEGEPPEAASELYRFVHGKRTPRLQDLQYTVFGLGDSSYEHFCQAARDFDRRLEALGAHRLRSRVEADVDFQPTADAWLPDVLEDVAGLLPERDAAVVPLRGIGPGRIDRLHPFRAQVLDHRRITTPDAPADVRHLALGVDPSVFRYQPGDSLGVWFLNDPALVEEILSLTGLAEDETVSLDDGELTLAEALTRRLELTQLHPRVVRAWSDTSGAEALRSLSDRPEALRRFATEYQLVDLIAAYPAHPDAATLAGLLLPLQPRLYSIASSQAQFDDEVHLTVATLRYQAHGRTHLGGASGYLAERLGDDGHLEVYVAENPTFRLPEDDDTPVIMIGAGTGIAPFRAFLQHRAARGGRGRNWLIPGHRHFHRDFLYQTDWLAWRKEGLLRRITPAFSRDGQPTRYVQDRLREEGRALWDWLDQGAQVYVCGGTAMEAGVRSVLADVAHAWGHLATDAAQEFVADLRAQGRYWRDVY
ncbi:MAG: flavodoxin domain-containing protein [Pseudomonadota bacterium]|nr:flavodoxin domain-containing protein [Pseudomonadota bacterium]